MATLNLTVLESKVGGVGTLVSFISPCNSNEVTAVTINGVPYDICDSVGNKVTGSLGFWVKDSIVTLSLNPILKIAHLLNNNASSTVKKFGDTMLGDLNLDGNNITNLGSISLLESTTGEIVKIQTSYDSTKDSYNVTFSAGYSGLPVRLSNIADPVENNDAVTKQYLENNANKSKVKVINDDYTITSEDDNSTIIVDTLNNRYQDVRSTKYSKLTVGGSWNDPDTIHYGTSYTFDETTGLYTVDQSLSIPISSISYGNPITSVEYYSIDIGKSGVQQGSKMYKITSIGKDSPKSFVSLTKYDHNSSIFSGVTISFDETSDISNVKIIHKGIVSNNTDATVSLVFNETVNVIAEHVYTAKDQDNYDSERYYYAGPSYTFDKYSGEFTVEQSSVKPNTMIGKYFIPGKFESSNSGTYAGTFSGNSLGKITNYTTPGGSNYVHFTTIRFKPGNALRIIPFGKCLEIQKVNSSPNEYIVIPHYSEISTETSRGATVTHY